MMRNRILVASVLLGTLPGAAMPGPPARLAPGAELSLPYELALWDELALSEEVAGGAGPTISVASASSAERVPPAGRAAAEPNSSHAVGGEFFYSSDSDGTEVARAGADFDLRAVSAEHYLGVRVERAWYNPGNRGWETRDRIYLRAAERLGNWQLRARAGTDGDTVIGSISLNDDVPIRKEFFVERDIVETPQGLDRGIYSTFAGAAVDLPVNDRNVFTAVAGVQAFTGDNVRLHLRGSYIHVLRPEWGLSAQLRGRYFHSSDPGEFDYYSPRWFAEVLPVLQMRRFLGGWEVVGAAGVGLQRDSGSDWRSSRYAHARFRSPLGSSDWSVNGAFTCTNTPSVTGTAQSGYSYVQFNLGLSRRF